MLLLTLLVLVFIHEYNAFDSKTMFQLDRINKMFEELGIESPPLSKVTIEEMDNPSPQLLMTELVNFNKQLRALKLLSKLPKKHFDKKVVRTIKTVLMEMQPAFLNLQYEDSQLKHRFHLSQEDINLFNYLYDETNLLLVELNCLYNRHYV